MQIIVPCDYFDKAKPDEAFVDQASAFADRGFSVHTLDFDNLTEKSRCAPPLTPGEAVMRGWMLSASNYSTLHSAITSAGATPVSDLNNYLAAHHIPNWYPILRAFTAETVVITDLSRAADILRELGWNKFFIKDFVKSLKSSIGSVIDSPEKIETVISEMTKFRGTIEGGLCVRRFEEYIPQSEVRYFVWDRKAYAPIPQDPIPEPVLFAAKEIPSRFFSVDLCKDASGSFRIVEIGDGQVSDVVGWSPDRLAEIFSG